MKNQQYNVDQEVMIIDSNSGLNGKVGKITQVIYAGKFCYYYVNVPYYADVYGEIAVGESKLARVRMATVNAPAERHMQ